MDAFEAAQRSIVATVPGSVFRYINTGPNVLGAVTRYQITRPGLPYHPTIYGLLADRLGMASYQLSADIAGNLIASDADFATLRDDAELAVLYLQDSVWNGGACCRPVGPITRWRRRIPAPAMQRASARTPTGYISGFAAGDSRASDQRILILAPPPLNRRGRR
jgi:CubicO group peptidase (beta-lactamase class C family)